MKVRIEYTVDLTAEQVRRLVRRSRLSGNDHDKPSRRVLLQRYLREAGESEIYREDEDEDQDEDIII